MSWDYTKSINGYGQFAVFVNAPNKPYVEVTYFRDVPARVTNYSFGDPFSDSTAEVTFPQVTPYDDYTSDELWFLKEWTNYDIYWVPASGTQVTARDIAVFNPETGQKDIYLNYGSKVLLWEGYSVSYEPSDQGAKVQCQGALFQIDRYLAKPAFVGRPYAMEYRLTECFNPAIRQLRTKPLTTTYPAGWTKTYAIEDVDQVYQPKGVSPGQNWTGYSTRSTGSWDRMLTGYCQDLLSQMYTDDECGVQAGNQWTIRKYAGRQPALEVRDKYKAVDFELWYGTPGVEASLSRDAMNIVNLVYGKGTAFDGTGWDMSNVVIEGNDSRTEYEPLAYDPTMWPYPQESFSVTNPQNIPVETLLSFSPGVAIHDATRSSKEMLSRDVDPGWTGNITIKIDPNDSLSKWMIRAGMTVLLRGFAGVRDGIRLHIAEAVHSPEDNSVSLRVDSRYRDLLTLEQVQARVRDALTPAKMLQVNRPHNMIEDRLAPWNYGAGSGSIPKEARNFWADMPTNITFPWTEWTRQRPPKYDSDSYVVVDANANKSKDRWTEVPLLLSQAGSARMIQIACVDEDGEVLPIPFHVSIYRLEHSDVPHTGVNYSPFTLNHFFDVDPETGAKWPSTSFYSPHPSIVIGWGNFYTKCGYWPNRSDDPDRNPNPTGLFVDTTLWSWNMMDNGVFDPSYGDDVREKNMQNDNARSYYLKIYADGFGAFTSGQAYFIGRVFRLEPGN